MISDVVRRPLGAVLPAAAFAAAMRIERVN